MGGVFSPQRGFSTIFFQDGFKIGKQLLSRMCAKVRTVLFLPRRVLLTTVVSDRRGFPDYGGDGPRRSAAMAGRTRHGSGRFGCQPLQVQRRIEVAVVVRTTLGTHPSPISQY